jgi:hypothetical protein
VCFRCCEIDTLPWDDFVVSFLIVIPLHPKFTGSPKFFVVFHKKKISKFHCFFRNFFINTIFCIFYLQFKKTISGFNIPQKQILKFPQKINSQILTPNFFKKTGLTVVNFQVAQKWTRNF